MNGAHRPQAAYRRSPVDIVGYGDRRLSHEPVPQHLTHAPDSADKTRAVGTKTYRLQTFVSLDCAYAGFEPAGP